MAAVQMTARAKHRHFRLFRWPPFKLGRLFMVQVVVAILCLRLICGSRLREPRKQPVICWACLKAAVCGVQPHIL